MADPTTPAQIQLSLPEALSSLGVSATIIIGLITVLYKRLNKDVEGLQHQQDEYEEKNTKSLQDGVKAFSKLGEDIVRIGEQIKQLQKEDEFDREILDRLSLEIKLLSERLLKISIQHDDCYEKVKKI